MPRSGTKSLYGAFKKVGIGRVQHQPNPRVIRDESMYDEYNIFDPPDNVKKVLEKRKTVIDSVESYIEVDWASSMIMYALSQICPEVRFFILIRDPGDCCNSLKAFRGRNRAAKTLEDYSLIWQTIYTFLCWQAENMQHKPFLIDLNRYAKGEYCELFLKLFGFDDSDKLKRLMAHVKKKVNSQDDYEKTDLSIVEYEKCMDIWQRLEVACKDSWIVKENLI